jgi:N-acetylmuramic acid 6-phosphate (MurNAc-6-P) etherase
MNKSLEDSKLLREKIETQLVLENSQPITELPNQLSTNIDLAQCGRQIVEILAQTDREIFDGWKYNELKSDGLKLDHFILDKLSRLADIIGNKIKTSSKNFKFIMSGCGTSGRIAYLCTKTFNTYMGKNVCEYIIAGDDFALVNSVESVEDKPDVGKTELIRYT